MVAKSAMFRGMGLGLLRISATFFKINMPLIECYFHVAAAAG